ncbi:hypothetical protein [Halosimplex carlsbadense]|uniref:hypothetical protein n=1 Tax=Halosimplex carlsbadense TaxID=171164 RepID=UPI0013764C66|nr:hypothetical protein [Halosimplex carlsbadense]
MAEEVCPTRTAIVWIAISVISGKAFCPTAVEKDASREAAAEEDELHFTILKTTV